MLATLIPETFFSARPDVWLWLMGAGAIALLVFGAGRVVDAAAKLASVLGMSKIIIGATVVSLGTTSPEACVSVMAACRGDSGLALGNAMGSIICDTALIFGLSCCLARLPLDRFILRRHGWLQFGVGLLLAGVIAAAWLLAGRDLSQTFIVRPVGLVFLALLAGYLVLSVRWFRRRPEMIPDGAKVKLKANHKVGQVLGSLAMVFLGLGMVVFGSEVLIGSAKVICTRLKVPETVIAGTFVAFGTSVPELVTALAAIRKGHPSLLVGNIVGADILNVLFVTGASASARPLQVDKPSLYLFAPMMLLALGLLWGYVLLNRKDTFHRWQGVPLLLCYAAFVALSIWVFEAAG
jgi:cation:H+ antiporter